MLEAKIQHQIILYLQSKKVFFCSIPNEAGGGNAAIRMAKMKAIGLRSGAPDLLVFLPDGLLICLEVKNENGRQSKAQKIFQTKLELLGFLYYVVRSVDDVQAVLNEHC